MCMFPHSFGYKKFPSNSIKVRREMWYTGWDSNPQKPESESGAYASSATGAYMVRSPGIEPGTC